MIMKFIKYILNKKFLKSIVSIVHTHAYIHISKKIIELIKNEENYETALIYCTKLHQSRVATVIKKLLKIEQLRYIIT